MAWRPALAAAAMSQPSLNPDLGLPAARVGMAAGPRR